MLTDCTPSPKQAMAASHKDEDNQAKPNCITALGELKKLKFAANCCEILAKALSLQKF